MPVSITTSGIVASENTVVAATILTDSSTSLLNFVANIVVVAAVGADVAIIVGFDGADGRPLVLFEP